jgi:hypothetical protein
MIAYQPLIWENIQNVMLSKLTGRRICYYEKARIHHFHKHQ